MSKNQLLILWAILAAGVASVIYLNLPLRDNGLEWCLAGAIALVTGLAAILITKRNHNGI